MIAVLLDEAYRTVEQRQAIPECGVDFCDSCGDCLRCYGDDPCPNGSGEHSWYVYADRVPEWLAAHA